MTGKWQIGTLWTGDTLDWAGQLCLTSYRDHGHDVTLFTLGPVAGVPEGVAQRDASDVLSPPSTASGMTGTDGQLWRDLFRLRMLRAVPGMLWVDPDSCCLGPLEWTDGHLFALDASDPKCISTAMLGLPSESAALADMLAFTSDEAAIAPFLRPKLRKRYAAAKAAGQPVPLGEQPEGIWGGRLLWYFLDKHGLLARALSVGSVGTIATVDAAPMGPMVLSLAAPARGRTGRKKGRDTEVSEHPLLQSLLSKHQIVQTLDAKPMRRTGAKVPTPQAETSPGPVGERLAGAELAVVLDYPGLASFADIGGKALALALAAQARHDCDLVLVDFDTALGFPPQRSAWVAPYLAELAARGIPGEKIRLITTAADLRPCDVVCAFAVEGEPFQVNRLGPVLAGILQADSRFLVDIRKGSGGFPFLAAYGSNKPLSRRIAQGKEVVRVCLHPDEPKGAANDAGWAVIAKVLAGSNGFFRANDKHSFLFIPRGDTLVVTFDNLDIAMGRRDDRRPWGFSFIEKQGWSMLGCMANGWTWYRDQWVSAEFDALAASGFFRRFARVVFYGASMGGYAACAFSGASPGADVVAISPQSTVDKAVVPWETRYKTVWGADFSGKYGDAATASAAARRVTLLYDPYEPLDAAHVARFGAANVVKLRAMMLGHRLGSSLNQMGILTPIILSALGGSLDEAEFYRTLRARRGFARYQRELFERLVAKGHVKLARQLGDWVLRQGENRSIRAALQALATS